MYAIYINDSKEPFTEMILDGRKTVETRKRNVLKCLLGERVAIVQTGNGKSRVVGYATITAIYQWYTAKSFLNDIWMHRVHENSSYFNNGTKYGYRLENVEACIPYYPKIIKYHGRSFTEIEGGDM